MPTRLTLIVVAALALIASPLPALAQSCALCYTQAASAGARMIQAVRSGILILILPPTLMSIGMIFVMYRNRNRCRDTAGTAESDSIRNETGAGTRSWHPPPNNH